MTVAQLEMNPVYSDLDIEVFNLWMSLTPKERKAAIQRMRDEVPGTEELADAFERHHRSLLARERAPQAAA